MTSESIIVSHEFNSKLWKYNSISIIKKRTDSKKKVY